MLMRTTMAGALALSLAACGTPMRVPMDPLAKSRLGEVKVIEVLAQDEVVVRPPPSASAGAAGGLLGVVIESKVGESRQNDLQAALTPFYASVDDFDFRSQFNASLSTALAQDKSIRVGQVEHASQKLLDTELKKQRNALPAGNALMVCTTDYTFSPDFTRLSITTRVEMTQPGAVEPLFKNTYFYQSAGLGKGGSESLSAWGENKGARYRSAAGEGASQIARMIGLDLAAGTGEPVQPVLAVTRHDFFGSFDIKGPVLSSEADRVIMRDTHVFAGSLHSLPYNAGGQPK
jgi:hypothetical protein